MRSQMVCAASVAALVVWLAAGCSNDDNRLLTEPSPDQTTTSQPQPTGATGSAAPASADAAVSDPASTTAPVYRLALVSSAFEPSGEIPAKYTCDGEELSPPLLWSGVPQNTVELGLVVRDLDANSFVHWVIAGIGPRSAGIAEGRPPRGAVEGNNDFDRVGWAGPCPPQGRHRYLFTLYASSEPIRLTAGMDASDAAALVERSPVIEATTLEGTYERP